MFIINPDPYSLPAYRIGPFTTKDLSLNHTLKDNDLIEEYFADRFSGKEYIVTENGREAINRALSYYGLKPDDVVTILTTSSNFYISGCVTGEIEKFCKWSRNLVPETKLIFVNHEFGYPYRGLSDLRKYNLPVIEDCAGSFFTSDSCNEIGNVGDFVIYSFPKMFPLQVGGLLVSSLTGSAGSLHGIDSILYRHIRNVLSNYINGRDEIIRKRLDNYEYLRSLFGSIGLNERFKLDAGTVPGVFMFCTDNYSIDLPDLKKYFWAHGVQCSVFYKEEAFFIPVHQALNEGDMDYFFEVMKSYLNRKRI